MRFAGESKTAPDRRDIVLATLAALILCVHWGLADFDPKPYGTLPVDGPAVELFAPVGGSPVLVFAVAALLTFQRRPRLKRALGDPPLWAAGIALLACAAAIGRWADYIDAPALLVPGLILSLLGACAVVAGRRGLAAMAAPAAFLIFAIPIPAGVVNQLVWPLQLATAASAEWLLRAIGYAPERFADIVVLAGHSFQVIESCSGLRMIETLVMAGSLYSILFFRRPAQGVAIVSMAPVIGYGVNLLRVLSIILNPYSEWGSIHVLQGIAMLVVGVLLIAGLDNALRWLERKTRRPARPRAVRAEARAAARRAPPVAVAALLAGMAIGNVFIPAWQPEPMADPGALRLPSVLAGSRAVGLKLERQFLGSVGVTKWLHREYTFLGSSVRVQILADDRLDPRGSLISGKTAVPGRGFVEISHDVVPLTGGAAVDRYLFASRNQRTLVYHWTEGTSGDSRELTRNALALDRGPTRRNRWAVVLRLSTGVDERADGLAQAEARLRGFAKVIGDAIP